MPGASPFLLNHIANVSTPLLSAYIMKSSRVDGLVQALLEQTPPPPEILLIDDGSTDGTMSLLQKWQEKSALVKVIGLTTGGVGKKAPLEIAIKAARFPILLCTDADCIPESKCWASTMVNNVDTKYDLKIGISLPMHTSGLLGRLQMFESTRIAQNYIGMAESGYPYMGVGRNIAFTKSCWEKVGGFQGHLDLASGDDDLFVQDVSEAGMRIGTEVRLEGQSHSVWPHTWSGWMRQMRRHLTTGPRYKTLTMSVLSRPHTRRFHVVFWVWMGLLFCGSKNRRYSQWGLDSDMHLTHKRIGSRPYL